MSIKLKCVTTSDYVVLMLSVSHTYSTGFSRGGDTEMLQLLSLWLSISVSQELWTLPNSRCAAVWPPPVACGMRVQSGRSEGPSASVPPKSWMPSVKLLNLKLYKWLDFKALSKSAGSEPWYIARVKFPVCNCQLCVNVPLFTSTLCRGTVHKRK